MRLSVCISCGNETLVFPLPSTMNPDLMACGSCIHKYGAENLAREADRLLAEYRPPIQHYCIKCKNPVLFNVGGEVPLYCQECEWERRTVCA